MLLAVRQGGQDTQPFFFLFAFGNWIAGLQQGSWAGVVTRREERALAALTQPLPFGKGGPILSAGSVYTARVGSSGLSESQRFEV